MSVATAVAGSGSNRTFLDIQRERLERVKDNSLPFLENPAFLKVAAVVSSAALTAIGIALVVRYYSYIIENKQQFIIPALQLPALLKVPYSYFLNWAKEAQETLDREKVILEKWEALKKQNSNGKENPAFVAKASSSYWWEKANALGDQYNEKVESVKAASNEKIAEKAFRFTAENNAEVNDCLELREEMLKARSLAAFYWAVGKKPEYRGPKITFTSVPPHLRLTATALGDQRAAYFAFLENSKEEPITEEDALGCLSDLKDKFIIIIDPSTKKALEPTSTTTNINDEISTLAEAKQLIAKARHLTIQAEQQELQLDQLRKETKQLDLEAKQAIIKADALLITKNLIEEKVLLSAGTAATFSWSSAQPAQKGAEISFSFNPSALNIRVVTNLTEDATASYYYVFFRNRKQKSATESLAIKFEITEFRDKFASAIEPLRNTPPLYALCWKESGSNAPSFASTRTKRSFITINFSDTNTG